MRNEGRNTLQKTKIGSQRAEHELFVMICILIAYIHT